MNIELLQKLCGARGISGHEESVRAIIEKEISDYASFYTDNLGNLICHKKGSPTSMNETESSVASSRKPILFAAHMDEVGLTVTHIRPDGLLCFTTVGGIDPLILPGKRVLVGKDCRFGVIGVVPVHLLKGEESAKLPAERLIDIGAKDAAQALKHVTPGDMVTFENYFEVIGSVVMGKALDDRVGCYILIELIKSALPFDTDFVFTVQEEVGTRGAAAAAFAVAPEIAVVVECTTASDIYGVSGEKRVCAVGGGAVTAFADGGTIYDRQLYQKLLDTAASDGIPLQVKSMVAGGNDSNAIQAAGKGSRVISISLPCRYLHSPLGVINREDLEATIRLTKKIAVQWVAG